MVNGWKVTAIIFIILFIFETLLFVWLMSLGLGIIAKESECQINVCDDYDSYYYDDYDEICYCYTDGEIEHQKFLGG